MVPLHSRRSHASWLLLVGLVGFFFIYWRQKGSPSRPTIVYIFPVILTLSYPSFLIISNLQISQNLSKEKTAITNNCVCTSLQHLYLASWYPFQQTPLFNNGQSRRWASLVPQLAPTFTQYGSFVSHLLNFPSSHAHAFGVIKSSLAIPYSSPIPWH